MARALIVGCGCRGRSLGRALAEGGWQVRGTTRSKGRLAEIEAAGLEGVIADPDRIGSVFEQVEGVAIVFWLLGTPDGAPDAVAALNGARLQALLEKLVDTPVRGLVFEAAGTADGAHLAAGARAIREASERWRIPVEVVEVDPADRDGWREAMVGAGERALLQR
jgi:nucleoside-diphosphate-sugar epimerase